MFASFNSTFGQSILQGLEQLVAPIPSDHETKDNRAEEEDDEEDDSFESKILQHINERRLEIVEEKHVDNYRVESPASSLVDVALDDSSEDSLSVVGSNNISSIDLPHSPPSIESLKSLNLKPITRVNTSNGFLSNVELEKRIQLRYREQLEKEIQENNDKHRRIEQELHSRILTLQSENGKWREESAKRTLFSSSEGFDNSHDHQRQQQQILQLQLHYDHHLAQQKQELLLANAQQLQAQEEILLLQHDQALQRQQAQHTQELKQLQQQLQQQLQDKEEEQLKQQHQPCKDCLLYQERYDSLKQIMQLEQQQHEQEIANTQEQIQQLQQELLETSSSSQREHDNSNSSHQVQQQLLQESERENDRLKALIKTLQTECRELQIQLETQQTQLEDQARQNKQQYDQQEQQQQQKIAALQTEIDRLNQALTTSEETLKETEEIAWKNKAEASELLWALQNQEEKAVKVLEQEKRQWQEQQQILQHQVAGYQAAIQENMLQLQQSQQLQQQQQQQQDKKIVDDTSSSNKDSNSNLLMHELHVLIEEKLLPLVFVPTVATNSNGQQEQMHDDKVAVWSSLDVPTLFSSSLLSSTSSMDDNKEYSKVAASLQRLIQGIQEMIKKLQQSHGQQEQQYRAQHQQRVLLHQHEGKKKSNEELEEQICLQKQLQAKEQEMVTNKKQLESLANLLKMIQQSMATMMRSDTSTIEGKEVTDTSEAIAAKLQNDFALWQKRMDKTLLDNQLMKDQLSKQAQEAVIHSTTLQQTQQQLLQLPQQLHQQQQAAAAASLDNGNSSSKLTILEDENRKLHQVISQLRSVRKQQNSEEQTASQEVISLRILYQALRKEHEEMQTLSQRQGQQLEELLPLRDQTLLIEKEKTRLEQAYQDAKRYLSMKEKENYDLQQQMDILSAEVRLQQQMVEHKSIEIQNMKDILSQIEKDYSSRLQQVKQTMTAIEQTRDEYASQLQQLQEQAYPQQILTWQEKYSLLKQRYEDVELIQRQRDYESSKEKKKMQKSLEQAIQQLAENTASKDVVDRTLIANLLTSYFQRRRSKEVLQLIARILQFNDEQLIAAGLKVPPINLFATLMNTVMGSNAATAPPQPMEGDNLAELWVNFLINQTDDSNNSQSKGGTTSNVSSPMISRNSSRDSAGNASSSSSSSGIYSMPPTPAGQHLISPK